MIELPSRRLLPEGCQCNVGNVDGDYVTALLGQRQSIPRNSAGPILELACGISGNTLAFAHRHSHAFHAFAIYRFFTMRAEPYNHLGGKSSFPGSYPVRSQTLRALFMDFASALGEQGFRWIVVVHVHVAGLHNRALDQAGDYFRDTYGGRMVHLWGLVPVIGAWGRAMEPLPAAITKEDGVSLHGGMDETSLLLYLKPSLVAPDYKNAPVRTGSTLEESMRVTRQADWPG